MKKLYAAELLLFLFSIPSSPFDKTILPTGEAEQAAKPDRPISANVEFLKLTSKVFGNTRTVRVLVPPGYYDQKNASRKYPVFYFNDGVMLFDPNLFHLERTVYQLVQSTKVPPFIVVGIDNGASTDKSHNPETDRANEFLPYPDSGFPPDHTYSPNPPNPQGQLYPDFLTKEVMTLIESKYRVKLGPSNTSLGGFSYGATSALYTVLKVPNTFGRILLESPPLWIGPDHQIISDSKLCKHWPRIVYLGYGTKEGGDDVTNRMTIKDGELLADIIRKNSRSTSLKFVEEAEAKHEFSAWSARFPEALQSLFEAK